MSCKLSTSFRFHSLKTSCSKVGHAKSAICNNNNYLTFITEDLDVFDCHSAKYFQPSKKLSHIIRFSDKPTGAQG